MSVLVVLEQREGKLNPVSFEALAAARKIAEPRNAEVDAAVLGSGIESLASMPRVTRSPESSRSMTRFSRTTRPKPIPPPSNS